MPWSIVEGHEGCAEGEWAVVKDDDGALEGCHATRDEAIDQLAALNAAEGEDAQGLGGGARWQALIAVEGLETDDGRIWELGAIEWRTMPLPLMIMAEDEHGGMGGPLSHIAGRIDEIMRDPEEPTRILAAGQFDTGEWGQEAERLVGDGTLNRVSIDGAGKDADVTQEVTAVNEAGEPVEFRWRFARTTVMGVTVVPHSAFGETRIWLADQVEPASVKAQHGEEVEIPEPEVVETGEEPMLVLLAASIPVRPPREWFEVPEDPSGWTPFHVTEEGQLFGHIGGWGCPHADYNDVTPPRSPSDYAYFHLGELICADGSRVDVGSLTMYGDHADVHGDIRSAHAHHDNVSTVVADIRAHDGEHGIWVCGAVRPHLSDEDLRVLMASKPSGEWWGVKGARELINVHCVNTPAFRTPRSRVVDGQRGALVAAVSPPDCEGNPQIVEPIGGAEWAGKRAVDVFAGERYATEAQVGRVERMLTRILAAQYDAEIRGLR